MIWIVISVNFDFKYFMKAKIIVMLVKMLELLVNLEININFLENNLVITQSRVLKMIRHLGGSVI